MIRTGKRRCKPQSIGLCEKIVLNQNLEKAAFFAEIDVFAANGKNDCAIEFSVFSAMVPPKPGMGLACRAFRSSLRFLEGRTWQSRQ